MNAALFAFAAAVLCACGGSHDGARRHATARDSARTATDARLPEGKGAIRYIAPRGSDRGPGTARAPWRTVQKALDTLKPGQTGILAPGRYAENVVVTRGGRRSAPVTLRGSGSVILGPGTGQQNNVPLEFATGAAYIRVKGITIEGATGPSTANVYASGTAHDIELSACEVRDSQRQGFFSERTTKRVQIRGCRFIRNGGSGPTQLDHNLYVEGSHHTIAGNLIEGAPNGYGIQLYPSGDHLLISHNTIVGNARDGIIIGSDDSTTVRHILVVNNVIAHNGRYGISSYWGGRRGEDDVLRRNLLWKNGEGNLMISGLDARDNIVSDPHFADQGREDYRLADGSPAIDRAIRGFPHWPSAGGRTTARQDPPDIGAYQRQR